MKAALCVDLAQGRVEVADAARPLAGVADVRISVRAVGLSLPDWLMVTGRYQRTPELPFIPGMELCGTVIEVGEEVSRFAIGDRVVAFSWHGALAEETAVPEHRVFHAPKTANDVEAACLLVSGGTALHAIRDRARLRVGETIAVLGASGSVGIASVRIARNLGGRVIGVLSVGGSEDRVVEAGAIDILTLDRDGLKAGLRRLTHNQGPDVVIDVVGGSITEEALRSMAWRGRLLIVGFASGAIPSVPTNVALLKEASIMGIYWGEFADRDPQQNLLNIEDLVSWTDSGAYKTHVTSIFQLDESFQALQAVTQRTWGRVAVQV